MSIIVCRSGNCDDGNRIRIEIGREDMTLDEWKALYEKIFKEPCPHDRIVDIYMAINDYLNSIARDISRELDEKT